MEHEKSLDQLRPTNGQPPCQHWVKCISIYIGSIHSVILSWVHLTLQRWVDNMLFNVLHSMPYSVGMFDQCDKYRGTDYVCSSKNATKLTTNEP